MRVDVSCDKALPARSPFFRRNQVRSETSPSRAQASALVKRQISSEPQNAIDRGRRQTEPRGWISQTRGDRRRTGVNGWTEG